MAAAGDKVGDVYVEVHAEVDRSSVDRAIRDLERRQGRGQRDMNDRLVRNQREALERANLQAIRLERQRQQALGRLQEQALAEDRNRQQQRQRSIQEMGRLQEQAAREDIRRNEERHRRLRELERAQAEAIQENARRQRDAIRERERLEERARRRRFTGQTEEQQRLRDYNEALRENARRERDIARGRNRNRGRRGRDGGPLSGGELFENLISILPGQLEKVFRDPKVAAVVIAAGTTIGSFLLAGIGGAIGAAGGLAALLGGVGLAISASEDFKRRGIQLGQDLLSGLQQSALNRLGPAIEDAFDYLDGANFQKKIVGSFDRMFGSLDDNLVPLVADINGGFTSILEGVEYLADHADPFLDAFGDGFQDISRSVGDLFKQIADNPELAVALEDMLGFVANLVDGFADLTVKAGEYWQIMKDLSNLKIPEAAGGKLKMDRAEARENKDPWWKDLLTGDFGGGGDKAYDNIMDRREAAAGMTEAAKKQEAANYNLQRSQALANDAVRDSNGLTLAQARALEKAADDAKLYEDAVNDAISANKRYSDSVSSGLNQQIDWANGIRDVKEAFKGQNDSISLNTEEGTKRRQVLVDQIDLARDQAQAVLEQTGSADKANAKFKELTDKIVASTSANGKNKDAIQGVIGKYKEFTALPVKPKSVSVKIDTPTFNGVRDQLATLTKDQTTTIYARVQATGKSMSEILAGLRKQGGDTVSRASGGPIFGPGTGTSDSIPANLSNGEFVIKAASAKKIGYANLSRMNATGKTPQGFAKGGRAGNGRGSSSGEARAYERLLSEISKLTKQVTAQSKALEQYNEQLSASRAQFASFVSLGSLDTEGKSTGDIIQQLQARKAKTGEFQKNLRGLRFKGLSAGALRQIADAGPDSDIAKLVMGGTGFDINLINSLLGGGRGYADTVANTIFPGGRRRADQLKKTKSRLSKSKKAAKRLRPVTAKGASIAYSGGKRYAVLSKKEMQQQNLKANTYVTVMVDGKEVRALVRQEADKAKAKTNRTIKSGRR